MAKTVRELPIDIKNLIDIREWDMRTMEGNKRFLELKAKSLPSIALDGELVYEALIPGQEDLSEEILQRWQLKAGS